MKALLIDSTRCVGCRGCQVACKEWNSLPGEKNTFFANSQGYQNPADLTAGTWTLITFNETNAAGHFDWVFGKLQCMHCNEPGCVTACPVNALVKTDEGPVVYDANICLGCRYCQLVCPFLVPRFEWDKALPRITKCTMCSDRISEGMEPACAKSCATDAIIFGERDKLIKEAEKRIRKNPKRYHNHIYGKDEVGGTCVLHISDVPIGELGHESELPSKPMEQYSGPAMATIPYVLTGLGVGLGAVSWIVHRRQELEGHNKEDQS